MKNEITLLLSVFIFILGCNGQSGRKINSTSNELKETTSATLVQPIYNIYLENSGSMDGYVQGVTEFEQAVYNFLVDIKLYDLTDSMNLFYINSKPIPNSPDIKDFIENLEPNTFKMRGGNRSATDLSQIFKTILENSNESSVSVFISDCVFSPGKGHEAKQYLVNQQIGIKESFASKLAHTNLTTVILQLSSKFEGNYYDCQNNTTRISAQRPYYIWIIGKHEYIVNLFDKVNRENFKGSGVQNFYCAYNSNKSFDYAILNSPKLGSYQRDKKSPKNKIINAEKADRGIRNGDFQFSVGVDLKSSLYDDKYIMNADNYIYPSNYTLEVLKNNIAGNNFTHILKLTTKSLKTENVNIKLKNNLPQWATDMNSDNDLKIKTPEQIDKTFGIKYLVEGIYEAYKIRNENKDTLLEINISVNQ